MGKLPTIHVEHALNLHEGTLCHAHPWQTPQRPAVHPSVLCQGRNTEPRTLTQTSTLSAAQNERDALKAPSQAVADALGPTCLAPRTTGTMHSGSVACVLSSIKMERNCILASLGSPAPTHVQQMTSAFWGRECARSQGTCRSRLPEPKGQAGRDADAALVHTLPDSIYSPGCGDPKRLRITPKKGVVPRDSL